jgi:hypothetical protein
MLTQGMGGKMTDSQSTGNGAAVIKRSVLVRRAFSRQGHALRRAAASLAWACLAGSAAAGLEERWTQVGGGGEWSRHADEDPYFFADAQGWTRSVHAGAGAGSRWLLALSAGDQRLRQEWWTYRGIRRGAWLATAISARTGVEVVGLGTSSWMRWTDLGGVRRDSASGWTLGTGVTWCPHPEDPAPTLLNVRLRLSNPADAAQADQRVGSAELNLVRTAPGSTQRLGLLASRADGRTLGAVLARTTHSLGRWQIRLDGLAGHQEHWLDVERLVLHDGARELRGMATGGLAWNLWRGLALEGSAGWEKVEGHESRWLYLGGRWTWSDWAVRP